MDQKNHFGQAASVRCVKVVVLNLLLCQRSWNIGPLGYSRAIFSAYRKEMNSHHFAFSLPSFASCDDVVHPLLSDKDPFSQDQMLSQFSCNISATVLLFRRSLFQWFEEELSTFRVSTENYFFPSAYDNKVP